MKLNLFYILIILFISLGLKRHEKIEGEYYNYFGSTLKINSDSTFIYTWRFDLVSSWTKGKWSIKKNIVYFEVTPIYDTLRIIEKKDTLYLSPDETPSLATNTDGLLLLYISSGGQDRFPMNFFKLYYKDNRLYEIDAKGKIIKHKMKGNSSDEQYNTWFVRKN